MMTTTSNGKSNMTVKNRTVSRIFDDLDAYRAFCVEFGYVFNEADLYKRNTPFNQFDKYRRGEPVHNNWTLEAAAMARKDKN